ncbi:MAG TPA: plastocyanin/azurin family copper-binding protein [Ktedonobacteraceae bacterium]
MYKKFLVGIALLAILSTVLAACSIHDTAAISGTAIHMGNANFTQSSVNVKKGDSVTFVDDVAVEHIITNGTWKNGVAAASKENGALSYNQTFNGNDSNALGPFTTSGTFHYYCTLHPGMNLTIVVS